MRAAFSAISWGTPAPVLSRAGVFLRGSRDQRGLHLRRDATTIAAMRRRLWLVPLALVFVFFGAQASRAQDYVEREVTIPWV